jgi:hypothetical protein
MSVDIISHVLDNSSANSLEQLCNVEWQKERETKWKGKVMAQCKALSKHLPGGTEKSHKHTSVRTDGL